MAKSRTVLHIDGNYDYMKICQALYQLLEINAQCLYIPESEQQAALEGCLKKYCPDILVLTGHDNLIKSDGDQADLNNYLNSKHFEKAVKAAREIEPDKSRLVIFAGACESHCEAILEAGANFASSPLRVLIHAFDPVLLIEQIAFTPLGETPADDEVIDNTLTGEFGFGSKDNKSKYANLRYQRNLR
jgi:spore coat assembly protein